MQTATRGKGGLHFVNDKVEKRTTIEGGRAYSTIPSMKKGRGFATGNTSQRGCLQVWVNKAGNIRHNKGISWAFCFSLLAFLVLVGRAQLRFWASILVRQ